MCVNPVDIYCVSTDLKRLKYDKIIQGVCSVLGGTLIDSVNHKEGGNIN